MARQRAFVRIVSVLAILSLFLSTAAPLAQAQDTSTFLPLASSPGAAGLDHALFRTRVSVATPAAWRDLGEMGVVFLDSGEDWALVLADDAQLADLARWSFAPEGTDSIAALAVSNAQVLSASEVDLSFLLAADAAAAPILRGDDVAAASTARAELRSAMQSVNEAQMGFLAAAVSADTDADGLNDTLEGYWCTDPAKADSDFDGTKDGAEVAALKNWILNKSFQYPQTGKPFQGWPPQKTGCFDDDQDSVPDAAETLELGLNANRESTDRDKFDDGQEQHGAEPVAHLHGAGELHGHAHGDGAGRQRRRGEGGVHHGDAGAD